MKQYYYLPVLLIFLASCASPQVVTRLTPEAPAGNYAMGREYIPLSSEGVEVELGFDAYRGDQLIFDLVVINHTRDSLHIDPEQFHYLLIEHPQADSSAHPPTAAIPPLGVMESYDMELEDMKEGKSANTAMGFVEAGFGLLAAATTLFITEDPLVVVDAVLNTIGTAGNYMETDKQIEDAMEETGLEKMVVSEGMFQDCSLDWDEGVSGYVYFPRHSGPGYYLFCFPIGEQTFQFVYRQEEEIVYQ